MDGQQNMAARYLYSAFGALAGKWGPMADANRIMFSSKEHFPNADDIYHFGSRDWFTRLHRWGSRDPLVKGATSTFTGGWLTIRSATLTLTDWPFT